MQAEGVCLRECKNTEFVWELRKTGFCEGGRKHIELSAFESVHNKSFPCNNSIYTTA